jgi:hypothetical protein
MSAPVEGVFDRMRLLAREFPALVKTYGPADAAAWVRDFGAGLGGALAQADQRFLHPPAGVLPLPMIAVPLCDGRFWEQDADTGIDWRKIVHAEEVITQHRPLPPTGSVRICQRVVDIRDRGLEKGALMVQRQSVCDAAGVPYIDIDVTTVLRGNGGFGGPAQDASRPLSLPNRAPDQTIEVRTPTPDATRLCILADLSVASGIPGAESDQRMIRGVGCFGLAGRALLALCCDNDPLRLRRFGVRYGGPMLTDETMRIELWYVGEGSARFRMHCIERDAVVVSSGSLDFVA